MTDDIFVSLSTVSILVCPTISHNQMTDDIFVSLSNVSILVCPAISHKQMTDDILVSLSSVSILVCPTISHNQMTDDNLVSLSTPTPQFTTLPGWCHCCFIPMLRISHPKLRTVIGLETLEKKSVPISPPRGGATNTLARGNAQCEGQKKNENQISSPEMMLSLPYGKRIK
ncbi:hypothetical protein ElyMa_006821400 [Elysia marginata]|uniref:AMP-dependent synthetase/ligase domain-containing protein n=1 Tax=Elysia marginata TaxID=1093978 RepID=A0AAV4J3J7_9GAST|nr:hypothetical protein ElyMa_006821400 [Elysia marginata]